MESERFADGLFMEKMPVNQAIFFEAIEDFFEFLPWNKFFLFDVISTLLNVVDAVNFVDVFEERKRNGGNLPFSFSVLIEDRRSEDFPDFGKRFFISELLFVFKISDIESNIANNAEIEESASVGSLEIFVVLAFRVERRISAEATPHIEYFRVIGEDR